MKKSVIEKRTKYTTNTYMREAINYEIFIKKVSDELFYTVKKYNKMNGDFSLINKNGEKKTYIKEGYYVVEITPLKENYHFRYYVDNNKRIIDYYVDVTFMNGEKNKIPFYVDLYLDILHHDDGSLSFDDENELLEAFNNKYISKKDYDFAYRVGKRVMNELKNNTNKYKNINVVDIINDAFGY